MKSKILLIIITFMLWHIGAQAQNDIQVERINKNTGSYKHFCILARFDDEKWNKEVEDNFIISLTRLKHITARNGTPLFPPSKNYTMEQIFTRLKTLEIFGLLEIHIENDSSDSAKKVLISELIDSRTGKAVWICRKIMDAAIFEQSDYKEIFKDYPMAVVGHLWQDKMIFDCGCM